MYFARNNSSVGCVLSHLAIESINIESGFIVSMKSRIWCQARGAVESKFITQLRCVFLLLSKDV